MTTTSKVKPTHRLKVKSKGGGGGQAIGAGWMSDNGAISIRLDVGAVLDWRMTHIDDIVITLFPIDREETP